MIIMYYRYGNYGKAESVIFQNFQNLAILMQLEPEYQVFLLLAKSTLCSKKRRIINISKYWAE